jgi:hypothetical protein
MPRILLTLSILACFASAASAQIYYEPVTYQYSAGGTTYYYGGHDPAVHAVAAEPVTPGGTWGRINGHAFVGVNRVVDNEPVRVFNDALRYRNAHNFGFTPADAMNDAYASAPRYFVKRDLLNAAVVKNGVWTVPAQAHGIRVFKSNGVEVAPPPATMPRPLMIIPKDSLQRPMPMAPKSDKQVAVAN